MVIKPDKSSSGNICPCPSSSFTFFVVKYDDNDDDDDDVVVVVVVTFLISLTFFDLFLFIITILYI